MGSEMCIRDSYHLEDGTLTVSTKRRRFRRHNLDHPEITLGENTAGLEDFTAKVTYFPDSRTGSMFEATIKQRMVWNGTFSSVPRLQVNLVLPGDSLVFQLVQAGRLADLKALLREGKASLRDHDELGNSLLVVSTNLIFQPIIFTFDGVGAILIYHFRSPQSTLSHKFVDFSCRTMLTLTCTRSHPATTGMVPSVPTSSTSDPTCLRQIWNRWQANKNAAGFSSKLAQIQRIIPNFTHMTKMAKMATLPSSTSLPRATL